MDLNGPTVTDTQKLLAKAVNVVGINIGVYTGQEDFSVAFKGTIAAANFKVAISLNHNVITTNLGVIHIRAKNKPSTILDDDTLQLGSDFIKQNGNCNFQLLSVNRNLYNKSM